MQKQDICHVKTGDENLVFIDRFLKWGIFLKYNSSDSKSGLKNEGEKNKPWPF